jgi:RNA polymerase sigma-70 factor, ECF subfamily
MEAKVDKKKEKQFILACEEHLDALFRYCHFKIGDKEVAKDLVQETYARVWNYLVNDGEIDNIRAFFYRTLSNLIVDEYRKNKPVSLDKLSESGFDPGFNDVEAQEDKLDAEGALEALKLIPEMYREVIFMKYVQDLSLREIAEITGETENTVAVKIHRGLKKIKEIFNQN